MSLTLRHNLTSDYLDAARRLSPPKKRRRIVAYVESYDDVAFWRTLLSEFETDERYFQVMLPSQTSLSKGKKTVLLNTLNQPEPLRAADLRLRHRELPVLRRNPARRLCAGHVERPPAARLPRVHAPLFAPGLSALPVEHLVLPPPMYEFNQCVRLQDVSLAHPYRCLDDVRRRVDAKLSELRTRFPQDIEHIDALGEELTQLGLTPNTTYLYIQGHHLMDGVVMKLLNPVCTQLRREREKEIRRLAVHDEQFHNELTAYENSLAAVQLMLGCARTCSGYWK